MKPGRILAMATVAVMTVAAGCSGGSGHPTIRPPAAQGTATTAVTSTLPVATSVAATSTVPATTSSTASSLSSGSRCPNGSLAVTLTDLGAAAGTAYRRLDLKNASTRSCTVQGYPGVSFVDARGAQIGAPVPRTQGSTVAVTLVPGGTAAALLAYHDAYVGSGADCRPTFSAALKVYPPDQTAALTLPLRLMVCANPAATGTAGISPLTTPANLHP